MNLYSIAMQNIIRRRSRMFILLASLLTGIAIAVALMMILGSMRLALGDQIDEFGANIVIVPRAEGMEIGYGDTQVARTAIDMEQLKEADLEKIKTIPDYGSINVVSPKIVAAVEANGQNVIMVGVDPRREFIMKPWYTLDNQAMANTGTVNYPGDLALINLPEKGLIIGADVATNLNLQTGDPVEINGNPFTVTGVLSQLGSVEDGLIIGNLSTLQVLLERPGEISMVEISAFCNSCPIEEIAAQLTDAIPNGRVTALRQAALLREETIDRFSLFSIMTTGLILLIASLITFTVMINSVHERTREIGIFRAIGFRSSHIVQIILAEAGFTGLLGGSFGYLAGSFLATALGRYLIGRAASIPWQTELILPAIGLAVSVSLIAAFYPAYKAANLDPAEALRFI